MTFYVYAITDRPQDPLPSEVGRDDAELAQIVWRDIGAVISASGGSRSAATSDDLWRHEAVVEALMAGRAVLPARFGTSLPSHRAVSEMLSQSYTRFVQDLERVRGHIEIGIRFLATAEHQPTDLSPVRDALDAAAAQSGNSAPPRVAANGFDRSGPGPGSVYLQAKVMKQRTSRNRRHVGLEMVQKLCATLVSQATVSRLDAEPADRQGISAAFLVPRDRLASFQAIVGRIADAHPELALLCTGPWPPYSFVSASAAEPATKRSSDDYAH
jgi:hypothetical protein